MQRRYRKNKLAILGLGVALLGAASAVPAQPAGPSGEPAGAVGSSPGSAGDAGERSGRTARPLRRRVVHQFDFEERDEGNFGSMPRHWYRVREPGMPRYTRIGFDQAHAWSPGHSLKLQLNGGSAAVTLERGALTAVPEARYLITARVRTARVNHSRARLIAVFVDHNGESMPATRTVSRPVRSNGRWTSLHVEPPPAPSEAGWLRLRLALLQPRHFRATRLGAHELHRQDLDAAAWFDDVTVFQLPRVELRTQDPTNIIRKPDAPRLSMRVHDRTNQRLDAAVRIYDHRGRRVAQQRRAVEPGRPGRWDWRPELPGPGWYWADLRVRTGGADEARGSGGSEPGSSVAGSSVAGSSVVGRSVTALLWMGPRTRDAGDPEAGGRFVIAAEDLPGRERSLLPGILDRLGSQGVLLSVWGEEAEDASGSREGMDGEPGQGDGAGPSQGAQPGRSPGARADPLIGRLIRDDRDLILSFAGVPEAIADPVGHDKAGPLGLLGGDPAAWRPYVRPILARYGGEVRSWQLGRVGSSAFEQPNPGGGGVHEELRSFFKQYVGRPRLLLPWRATDELTEGGRSAGALMMHVPSSIRPNRIPDHAESWSKDGELVAHLGTLGPERYSHEDRATDLALRMLHAWRAGLRRLAIDRPWDSSRPVRGGNGESGGAGDTAEGARLVPDPLLGVWTTVAEHLKGRRYVGELRLGEGRVGYLLDGPAGGLLAVWNRGVPESKAELRMWLGGSPVATDIWGQRHAVSQEGRRHRIRLRSSPLLIEGLDMELARFRAGFRVEPDFLRSEHAAHEAELVVENPWSRTITGRLRVTGPERWEVRPRMKRFSIPAGETRRVPVEVNFPVNELTGEKQVTAAFEVEADRRYELELAAPVAIGLGGVELESDLERVSAEGGEDEGDGGEDVLITLRARNVGVEARSFYAFAMPPGAARQQRIISSLEPGETVVKKFRLPGMAEALSGKRIRVGLRSIDGPAVLNHELEGP